MTQPRASASDLTRVRTRTATIGWAVVLVVVGVARAAGTVELTVDGAHPGDPVDLTRYALGQGGLSDEPMFDTHLDQVARLKPRTIRLFVQEYFNLYPERGRYHWDTLDRSLENILATGAKPILSLCFKPRVLYPQVNQDLGHPADYAEWEALIEAMVRHCNLEQRYSIEYWEVGNEVDIGESGGCPYRFQPRDYTNYYAHTAAAILRADPTVKVGGPALASHTSPVGDALIDFCGQGGAPLHFFSWHLYDNDPANFRQTIRAVKQKLARHPRLADTETIIDEWNIALIKPEAATGFQAAFVLENTLGFLEEGLARGAYYHIRDFFVDPADFEWMSPAGLKFMADWWNVKPQNSGLFDNQGRRRPAYYAFQMLSHLRGQRLPVTGATNGVQALAAREGGLTHVVIWSFAPPGKGATNEVVLRLPADAPGFFHLTRLDPIANRLDVLRTGPAAELGDRPLRFELAPYGVAWLQWGEFKVRASWGHGSTSATPCFVKLLEGSPGVAVADISSRGLETGEEPGDGAWQTQAGAGDVDGVEFGLSLPSATNRAPREEQSIWTHLLKESDPDTARRLRQDPAFLTDPALLTFKTGADGTKGFSVSVDQLLEHEQLWVPESDVFLSVEPFADFAAHQRALSPLAGRRLLDRVQREPEATYAQFTNRWEDMGNPNYRNPHSVPPGHVVGVTWDSAVPKFGIDRWAGVMNDYGNPDRFRFSFDLTGATWKGQRLTEGLPVLVTTLERDGVRYEVEQFAYPLQGPPTERRGDIEMVLLQKVTATNLNGAARAGSLRMHHSRELPASPALQLVSTNLAGTMGWFDSASNRCLLLIEGAATEVFWEQSAGRRDTNRNTVEQMLEAGVALARPAAGHPQLIVKLPSPAASPQALGALAQLDYAEARADTLKFWSNYLARGAQFVVPDPAVNELFRANLWHALRLPRRHGDSGPDARIDLPYSNFAYDQKGTPWPVNQAVYVDYMLYDLRGYHDLSREELLAIYRNNQEPNGHVGGFANWGVYTPGVIYSVAKHYLLSRDRASFEQLLPPTLRALDWCLAELREAEQRTGPTRGLVLAPLNDLSHDPKGWAFNQAYFYAGLDLLGRALDEIQHPRAAECRSAAQTLQAAIARAFGHASLSAPLVQLRDHTWSPCVPGDAFTPRRQVERWYPTDVDTGPLHLARLQALDPGGALTTAMLHDHEDNLFLKGWGMANEPVYNPHATAYLLRDDANAAIRAFYSMMACAFSHSTFEPVEHRWAWGQYFGPPSTDGAWFELYRNMLIQERGGGSLLLAQATPRAWLEDGQRIEVRRAPTYCGPLSFRIESRAASGTIQAIVDLDGPKRPDTLLIRLRHPTGKAIQRVEVNGRDWSGFDATQEWIRLAQPAEDRYRVVAYYHDLISGDRRPGDQTRRLQTPNPNLRSPTPNPPSATALLADEVRGKGWIAYGARSDRGDWDLFLCRPDGSERRRLTATPDHNEFSPQFTRDGRRLLYRRMARSETIDNNRHGEQGELVMAKSDGSDPQSLGKEGEYPWASWSPDGRQVACLSIKGILLIDVETRQVTRALNRKGFFQQLVWSPDGRWLCGVANSFGASWSVARLNVATGEASAVHRVDCCTPDWFPDSQSVLFSWRPPGQKANKGYGWTRLWRADAEGKSPRLVYGEDGRHVYGGHVSPDGRYVLFTGNVEEDGDPGKAGAPMALMRLEDAPIIRGESPELRAVHPDAGDGPVLALPVGWEPCWTFADAGSAVQLTLAQELHDKGWLAFSAKTDDGDWDLFLMRPDGTERHKVTDTREFNEAGVRFSPDGRQFLYYRMPQAEPLDNNTYGTFELVIAQADGRSPVVYGNGFPWASWGPDGSQLACLTSKGIQIIDVASRQVVRQLPRKGLVQQLVWSPDGKWFAGTANGLGEFWNIGRLNPDTGDRNAVSEVERYNCTPDWFPDSRHIVYSRGIIPQQGGHAELWAASADGRYRSVLYAEGRRHLYGGCPSPDGRYVVFTRSVEDLGKVDNSQTTMAIIRRSDTPMIGDESPPLRARLPDARTGPRLDLVPGWEPHWTFADVIPHRKEPH